MRRIPLCIPWAIACHHCTAFS